MIVSSHLRLAVLEDRAGTLRVGTREGLWQVRGDAAVRVAPAAGVSSTYVSTIEEDTEGNVWIGTRSGLARIRGGMLVSVPGAESLSNITCVLTTTDGSVWAGTDGAGLARVQGGRCTKYEVDEGTAMFKLAETARAAPVEARFLTLDADGEAVPKDWYLRLAGEAQRVLLGAPVTKQDLPIALPRPVRPPSARPE